jgi:glycosyltransferase involved in cell wall biosynthesis
MNITFLVPCKDLAGGLRVVACYGNALIRRGHRVTVIYPRRDLPLRERWRRGARRVIRREKDHLDYFRGRLLEVPSITERHVPDGDCLIATSFQTAEWSVSFPERCGKKFYLIQGYEKMWAKEGEDVDATFRMPFRKIVISRWLQETVEAITGEADIPLIPNGRDFHLSEFLGEGLQRTFHVGCLYSPVPLKRTGLALAAIMRLKKDFTELRVAMFGSEWPDTAQHPTFPFDTVTFLNKPTPDKVRDIYLNTRIWLVPSGSEGFCLPALEAVSLGCTVVSTDNGGIRDIISDGVEGYIVAEDNPEALAAATASILGNPALELRLRNAALLRADAFSWERSTDMLETVLTSP